MNEISPDMIQTGCY